MLVCPKCQYDNELGRIFCAKCGEKLDLNRVGPQSGVVKRARSGKKQMPFGKIVASGMTKFIEVIMLAAVAAFLTLIMMPPQVFRKGFDDRHFESYQNKQTQLIEAVSVDQVVSMNLDEEELNSMLSQVVKQAQKAMADQPIGLDSAYVSIRDGVAVVVIQMKWKYFRLVFSLEVKPALVENRMTFVPVGARVGRVRVPPESALSLERIQKIAKGLLNGLETEKQILAKTESLVFKPGQVSLKTRKTDF
ncbi:MAG: zinc ribbon domain-containing protein [Verrucomicrobiae bacterium]|nr:zinc ribbon domain-containing protein [Verrucomicrobiae bacterium]